MAEHPDGNPRPMGSWRDEDDWVGTPPEGRHSRDRARPEFWWRQRWINPAAIGIGLVVVGLVLAAILG